jgi:hypothetical protein
VKWGSIGKSSNEVQENVEDYVEEKEARDAGGLHPVSIGQEMRQGSNPERVQEALSSRKGNSRLRELGRQVRRVVSDPLGVIATKLEAMCAVGLITPAGLSAAKEERPVGRLPAHCGRRPALIDRHLAVVRTLR